MDYETAVANLRELARWASAAPVGPDRNEATTRLQFIDRLLIECLGWLRDEVVCEERENGRYADYVLGAPAHQAVVEAKREGIYFELPVAPGRDTLPLEALSKGSQELASALEQAMQYCLDRGVPIGAVCNGHQLVAFVASRQDGVPPRTGRALVFRSLQEIEARFLQLWNALSPTAVQRRELPRMLEAQQSPPPPEKLSARLVTYPGYQIRTPLQTNMQILGELFIEDLTRDPALETTFLSETYCASGALSQYALISKEILRSRYAALFAEETGLSTTPAQTKAGLDPQFARDALAAGLSNRPIILLGDVGVGKTIFIRHLILVEAREVFEKSICLYIDFGREPALTSGLSVYVAGELQRQLREDYGTDIEDRQFVRGVYNLDLQRFARGIHADLRVTDEVAFRRAEIEYLELKLGDRESHMKASLSHLSRGRGQQVVIFLDNIDQRENDFQDLVFLMAQSFAESWPATVFVSLRPDTFHRSRLSGTLAAYQPRAFTISPPRIDHVINKRLSYGLALLRETKRLGTLPQGVTLESASLEAYLTVIQRSFDKNFALAEFIDNVSGGNVRRALDFLSVFIGSGHVDTQRILDIEARSGDRVIPLHDFMRAVMLGDRRYYSPDFSPIANVFDTSTSDAREHFLLPLILATVGRLGDAGGGEGFVSAARIFGVCQALGFLPEQVNAAFRRGLSKQLVQRSPEADVAGVRYRLTTVGAYAFKKLVSSFNYIDAVIVDTPIMNGAFAPQVGTDVQQIEDRLARAEALRAYLDTAWKDVRGTGTEPLAFSWPAASAELQADIDQIRARIPPR